MYLPDTKQIARDIGATAVNHTWKSKNRGEKKLEKTHKNVAQQQLEMGVVCGPGQQCGTGGMLSICSSFDCSFFRSFVVCLLHLTRTANKTKKRQQNSRNEQSLSLCFTTVCACVCGCG